MPVDTALHFSYPIALWLYPVSLLVLIVLLAAPTARLLAWHSVFAALSRQRYRHPLYSILARLDAPGAAAQQPRYARWRIGLSYAVFLGLVHITLAQPYRLGQQLPEPPQHRDIVFLVDTSVSMLLRDYIVKDQRTDRMTLLKGVLTHFIHNLSGSRIAIVAYSEQPYTLVPLTTDSRLLQHQLQRLEPAVLTGRTSNLSKALLYAANQFADKAEEKPVFVLLSDTNRPHREIDPRAVADYLAQQGYRLHLVAIGAASYAAAEKDVYNLVYHPANFQLLEDIAQRAQGRFFWAKSADELNQALHQIQQAERRKIEVEAEFIHLPLYHWPLLLALVWLSAWQLLPLILGRRE